MADDRFEDVIWVELTFDGVVHRMSMSPEQARRWLEREEAIGMGRGEPMVEKDGRLVEHHGFARRPACRAGRAHRARLANRPRGLGSGGSGRYPGSEPLSATPTADVT